MNKLYEDAPFDTIDEQIQSTIIILVCLLFSTGMPILYPLALLYFVVAYCVNKYVLLYNLNVPKYVSPRIADAQIQFIMMGVFCHMLFGLATVTEPSMQRSFEE